MILGLACFYSNVYKSLVERESRNNADYVVFCFYGIGEYMINSLMYDLTGKSKGVSYTDNKLCCVLQMHRI